MTINYINETIELTNAEAKEAGIFNSTKYIELKEAKADTGYRVVVLPKKRNSDRLSGLTYTYMKVFIEKKGNDRTEELMNEFNKMRGCIDGKRDSIYEKNSYADVRAWFLEQFPEIEEFNNKVKAEREERKERREEERIAKRIA